MKKAIICAVLAAMTLLLTACPAGAGTDDPGSAASASGTDWIKECLFEYLKENGKSNSTIARNIASWKNFYQYLLVGLKIMDLLIHKI